MALVRARLKVKGGVQGVGYRAWTRRTAESLGLTGWVRNLPDGAVEILAEGDKEQVEELVKCTHVGPPSSQVDEVDVLFETFTGEFAGFEIVRA